ncbi:MAG: DUF642 domain-containing protein [Burkholderiaceae bacterium]|nr:DUF642 domain-containing protein [Burkholderiaceae bacterium]
MRIKTVAAVALALACSTSGAANLLTNGSFEAPNIVGGSYALYATNSTAITGWTVLGPTSGDSVQLTPDTYLGLRASDGRQWIDLTGIVGYDKGVQSDAFATVVGATYRISFDVGNYLPFGQATVGLSVAGGAEQLFTNTSLASTSTNPMNWTSFSVDWVANTTSTRLSLLGRANGALSNNLGIGLDNVSVERVVPTTPVPEPETWSLMMVGLAAFALTARRGTV